MNYQQKYYKILCEDLEKGIPLPIAVNGLIGKVEKAAVKNYKQSEGILIANDKLINKFYSNFQEMKEMLEKETCYRSLFERIEKQIVSIAGQSKEETPEISNRGLRRMSLSEMAMMLVIRYFDSSTVDKAFVRFNNEKGRKISRSKFYRECRKAERIFFDLFLEDLTKTEKRRMRVLLHYLNKFPQCKEEIRSFVREVEKQRTTEKKLKLETFDKNVKNILSYF